MDQTNCHMSVTCKLGLFYTPRTSMQILSHTHTCFLQFKLSKLVDISSISSIHLLKCRSRSPTPHMHQLLRVSVHSLFCLRHDLHKNSFHRALVQVPPCILTVLPEKAQKKQSLKGTSTYENANAFSFQPLFEHQVLENPEGVTQCQYCDTKRS